MLEIAPVLAAYPADCQPSRVEPLGSAGGFSGASFWRLTTPRGPLCLRRWPAGYPAVEQLQFIQAVLWHVDLEGFDRIPLPLEAASHAGYVRHDGHVLGTGPLAAGRGRLSCRAERRPAAKRRSWCWPSFIWRPPAFRWPTSGRPFAAACVPRQEHFSQLAIGGDPASWRTPFTPGDWPELADRAPAAGAIVLACRPTRVHQLIAAAARLQVRAPALHSRRLARPCAVHGRSGERDCRFRQHAPDNVATDVARLLGSLVADDRPVGSWDWRPTNRSGRFWRTSKCWSPLLTAPRC